MKNLILILMATILVATVSAQHNTIISKTVQVRDSIKLNKKWYKTIVDSTKLADSIFLIKNLIDTKQNVLQNTVNIKTVNGNSLLGAGDLLILGNGGIDSNYVLNNFIKHPFGGNIDTLFKNIDVTKIRFAYCAIRPSYPNTNAGTPITWNLISDVQHTSTFFTGVSANGGTIDIAHKIVKRIISGGVNVDETGARFGIFAGPSIGISSFNITSYYMGFHKAERLVWGGANFGNTSFATTTYNSTNNQILITLNSLQMPTDWGESFGTTEAVYSGTNNRYCRSVYSGLGNGQTRYVLVDPATGSVMPADINDAITIKSPSPMRALQVNQFGSNSLEKNIYLAGFNYWVWAVYEDY